MIKNFTVGPAKLFGGVVDFLGENLKKDLGELSHRSAEFSNISENTQLKLREFFNIPQNFIIFYTYSATEGMEILTRNLVGKKSCHIVNGNFGNVWAKTAQKAKKEVQIISNKNLRVEISDILPESKTELLAITANETSTGIAYSSHEIAEIRENLNIKNAVNNSLEETLLAVDITSSMGAIAYDFNQADAWFFSVQKALGMPAGLGILLVNEKVLAKSQKLDSENYDIGCHHSLSGLVKKIGKFQTPTTPNVLNIATLGFIAETFIAKFKNIKNLEKLTNIKADYLYDFIENKTNFKIPVNIGRSQSIIVAEGSKENITKLHQNLARFGYKVGTGYGSRKKDQIRIANFPVHSLEDIKKLCELF
jgi:phosphoserine aminotransferase